MSACSYLADSDCELAASERTYPGPPGPAFDHGAPALAPTLREPDRFEAEWLSSSLPRNNLNITSPHL